MKKNDDFLSDIENDIFGNWEDIQKKIKDEKFEKQAMENPQAINCPSFLDFYKRLLKILTSWDRSDNPSIDLLSSLHDILRMIFHGIEDWPNPLPDSFHRVWELFCNPRDYKCDRDVVCNTCNKSWDIVMKNCYIANINEFIGDHQAEMTRANTARISCPDCGYPMRNYIGREIVGVFRSDHDGEQKYDFRRKF